MLDTGTAATGTNKKETDHGFQNDVERLGQDVGQLRDDLAGIVRSTGDAAQTGVAAARESAKRGFEAAKTESRRAVTTIRGRLADHPGAVVGVAVGVGICIGLIGAALARSSRGAS